MSLELLQHLMPRADRQKMFVELQQHSTLDVFGAAATLDASSRKTKRVDWRTATTQHLGCLRSCCNAWCLQHKDKNNCLKNCSNTAPWQSLELLQHVVPPAELRHPEDKENGKLKTNRLALILHTLNWEQHGTLTSSRGAAGCGCAGCEVAASSRNSWIQNTLT